MVLLQTNTKQQQSYKINNDKILFKKLQIVKLFNKLQTVELNHACITVTYLYVTLRKRNVSELMTAKHHGMETVQVTPLRRTLASSP